MRACPRTFAVAAFVVATLLVAGLHVATGAAPSPKPSPKVSPRTAATPNATVVGLAKLTGRDLDIAVMRELLARFEEDTEITYAATLNADHPPLLQWNQKMIERKSGQIKALLGLLKEINAAPGRRGVNVVTPDVKQMRQMKGAPLERKFLPLMIERFETNVAIASLTADKGASEGLKTLAGSIARTERQEITMLKTWLKEWYGR
jgi:uncharacterized protein (DUF305 family)